MKEGKNTELIASLKTRDPLQNPAGKALWTGEKSATEERD